MRQDGGEAAQLAAEQAERQVLATKMTKLPCNEAECSKGTSAKGVDIDAGFMPNYLLQKY